VHGTLRVILNVAVRAGRLRVNPAAGLPLPRPRSIEQRYLTPAQIDALATAVPERYRAAILLAAYGGLRASELWGLKRGRVNVLRGRVDVAEAMVEVPGGLECTSPTNHQRRTVALPPFLIAELDEHRRTFTQGGTSPDAITFTGARGDAIRPSTFRQRVFAPAVKAALPPELARLRFHDLRHTAAALMIATGAHAKVIQTRLGHASITVTLDRYGHSCPAWTRPRSRASRPPTTRRARRSRLPAVERGTGCDRSAEPMTPPFCLQNGIDRALFCS
jgi:integrase